MGETVKSLEERIAALETMAHPAVDLMPVVVEALAGMSQRDPADSQIKAYFIIVRHPNCVPEKKRPWQNTYAGALTMLRELIACRPADATLTLCQLTWNDDLWADCGREAVKIDDMSKPHRKRRPHPGAQP